MLSENQSVARRLLQHVTAFQRDLSRNSRPADFVKQSETCWLGHDVGDQVLRMMVKSRLVRPSPFHGCRVLPKEFGLGFFQLFVVVEVQFSHEPSVAGLKQVQDARVVLKAVF